MKVFQKAVFPFHAKDPVTSASDMSAIQVKRSHDFPVAIPVAFPQVHRVICERGTHIELNQLNIQRC